MRIRTDGKFAYREDTIDRVAAYYDVSKTRSMLAAAEDVPRLVDGVQEVLEREDLTIEQRREIATTFSTRSLQFDVVDEVTFDRDP
jgi:hypothetical protein